MITVELLERVSPGTVIGAGVFIDGPQDANINGSGKLCRWVAVRGGIRDWAVYVGPYNWMVSDIAKSGDKVSLNNAQRFLCIDGDSVRRLYRE